MRILLAMIVFLPALFLSGCAGMGQVTYSGNVKGLPIVVVVGK